ncbi:MAG: tetratricopeptide repeat protein [Planctomycetaceae bacterium]|nr:tetratricopeptide repeat protein [Planctomycetaceae bacterium]
MLTAPVFSQEPGAAADLAEDPERRQTLQFMAEAEKAIGERQWVAAAESFDAAWALSVEREDSLLTINTDVSAQLQPGEHELHAGARSRLQKLFTESPAEFHRAYTEHVAEASRVALQRAEESSYEHDLMQAILRYEFTDPARQVLRRMIRLYVSRGQFLHAALQHGRLMRLEQQRSAEGLTQLAWLWWRAGLQEEAESVLRDAVAEFPGSRILLNGRDLNIPSTEQNLRDQLPRLFGPADASTEWQQPLGNYRRTRTQPIVAAEPRTIWEQSSFECLVNPELQQLLEPVRRLVDVETAERRNGETLIPVGAPVVAGDLLIYRGVANVRAVDRRDGHLVWESFAVDRRLTAALEAVRRMTGDDPHADELVRRMLATELLKYLHRTNSGGQLTSDGEFVFSVEEVTSETLEVDIDQVPGGGTSPNNYLRVVEAQTGRICGIAGGAVGAASGHGPVNPMA